MWTIFAFSNSVRNEPPWSCDIWLITIWPCLFSLSSTLFFSSSSHQMPVYLYTCMELDIYKQSTPETLHTTSCESSCVSMRPIIFYCCISLLHQEKEHFYRTPHQVPYTRVAWQQKTILQKWFAIPMAFLKQENGKLAIGYKYSQWLIARGTLPSLTHTWWCHRKVGKFA